MALPSPQLPLVYIPPLKYWYYIKSSKTTASIPYADQWRREEVEMSRITKQRRVTYKGHSV